MSIHLPKVYPITDTTVSGLSHAEQVKRLLDGGASLIQVREKHAAPRAFYDDAAKALRITRAAGARLIIDDRVDVALALGADGVHLGQTDMPVEAARRLLGADAIIGFSTHTFDQVQAALSLAIDYLACGPIYSTSTKENPDPVVGLSELHRIKSIARSLPLVAIGGINFSNARDVLAAGADAVAVISAVLTNASKITEQMRDFRQIAED
jgi:thiamine-phosphate pyrophosphorylase